MANKEDVEYIITEEEPVRQGFETNDAIYFILNYLIEDSDEEKEYRNYLKKRDSKKYNEYLEYEKILKEAEKNRG